MASQMAIKWRDWSGDQGINDFFVGRAQQVTDIIEVDLRDIVFVHDTDDTEWKDWVAYAQQNPQIDIVRMSRSPSGMSLSPGEELSNVHACEYKADRLEDYPRVKEFFSSVSRGTPEWQFLELERFPEYLVAGYLLMLVAAEDSQVDRSRVAEEMANMPGNEQFWDQVQVEADIRTWSDMGLPADWRAYRGWPAERFRVAIGKVRDKLAGIGGDTSQ